MRTTLSLSILLALLLTTPGCLKRNKPDPVAETPKVETPQPEPKREEAPAKPFRPGIESDPVQPQPAQPPLPQQPVKAQPVQCAGFPTLNTAYQQNVVAADMMYLGKQVAIADWYRSGEVKKSGDGYVMIGTIGQGQKGNVLYPVYGVGCNLSTNGAKQYATLKNEDAVHLKLVGTVKGTKPYPDNIFGGFMVILDDCYFTSEFGDPDAEWKERIAKDKEEALKKLPEEKKTRPGIPDATVKVVWGNLLGSMTRQQGKQLGMLNRQTIEVSGPIISCGGKRIVLGVPGDTRLSHTVVVDLAYADEGEGLQKGQTVSVVGTLEVKIGLPNNTTAEVQSATLTNARLKKIE